MMNILCRKKTHERTAEAHDKERAEEGQCHALTVDVQAVPVPVP